MNSPTLYSAFDRIAYGLSGSVRKSAGRYSKRCLRTRFRPGSESFRCVDRGRLLEQLEVCAEELNVAIMAELDERERINQELREEVHQQLDIARGLIYGPGGSQAHKALFTKFDNLVSDRSKRLKSDNLRKLLEHIKNLQIKAEINQSKVSEQPTVEPVSSTTTGAPVPTPCPQTKVVSAAPQEIPKASAPVEQITAISTTVSPVKEVVVVGTPVPDSQNDKPAEEVSRPPREIISEQAKMKQKAQIPWRPPARLEPFRIPKKSGTEIKVDAEEKVPRQKTPLTDMPEPLPLKEPERLALRYKTKVRKRPAEESPPSDVQFKKPSEPLFQRRHQLAMPAAAPPGPRAGNFPMQSRDPRNYGDYCNRRMTLMQNRARFERQNQQYFPPQRHPHEQNVPRPVAAAHPFAVPAPVHPASHRPPAPKASVAPNASRPAAATTPPVEPVAPVPTVVRSDNRKTNPVYSNDEPIRLGKKDAQKKDVSATKPAEEVVLEPKPVEETVVEKKTNEEATEKEKSTIESKKAQKEKDNALQKNLLDMLKELGDEKAKQILDVMGKKSDDESEKTTNAQQEEQPKRAKAGEKKTGKKFKRIRAKQDESSSDEEASKKDQPKKEKTKPAKRVSGGSREVSALIENSSDWMSKGSGENHYTRRRATAVQLLVSPPKQEEQKSSSKKDSASSDEEGSISSKQPEEDSLLTVARVEPAVPTAKGKQKTKEPSFVYNDKKTVHCNSNFSSNCALCSFNGSAIVDHYVYDHKTYEVFVSRVSPKMADIIRADLFMTNGTLVSDDDSPEEKIRFKCYFCLAPKELGRTEWTDHLSSHTGEYRYRCTSCPVMSRTEELGSTFFHEKSCLKPTLAVYNNIEFEQNHLYGFICDACNYIQIRRVNMERHLKREHPSSDVTCSRFSILNYKVETKPIIDEEQLMMAEMASSSHPPTVMIPFAAKAEPMDTYEIVNQPFTEDEEMPELPAVPQLPRRTDIRLESVHIGQVGVTQLPNQLSQLPFTIKMEPDLQRDAISSSFYESPMSPEPAPSSAGEQSEAQAAIPVLHIESVYSVKQEKPDDDGCDSDASDTTVDLNMSEGGRQCATDTNQQNKSGASPTGGKSSSGTGSAGTNAASEAGSSSGGGSTGGAAGGGDDGDDRKKQESFPAPFKIKVEKDEQAEEEERKKKLLQGVTEAMENVQVKQEKLSDDPPPAEGQYDFAELVLDSKRMEHVAFVEQNSEALYLCIIPTCGYITKVADDIGKHIARKHSRVIWDGYCQTCRSQILPSDCPISGELQHLLTIHARKKTPPLELPPAPTTVVQNVIRIRRMPGDTLSAGDPAPPPLMPILQTVLGAPPSPAVVSLPATVPFATPMIIQSAATISPISAPVSINQLFTPTHTIPAQIRPISATVGSSITVAHGLTSPPIQPAAPAIGNMSSIVPIRTVHLKPWTNMVTTKTQEHCRSMLEETSLLCLFKCMSRSCAFSTNKRMFMAQHLALHDQTYTRGTTPLRKCWLECAYCDICAPNSTDLLRHVDTEHANCGFQCNLCFYRSRDPTNVVVHQKEYHPTGDVAKKILIMPDNLKSFGDDEWRAMQESLRQHVLPLHCTICKESFYILSAYMTHLTAHSQSMINCQVCQTTIDKKVMARHLLQHSIGLYECVYCLFGANTKSTMALHVSNAHSSKPLYCCVRYNKQRSDGVEYPPNKIESMELKTMSCTVSPDLFKRCNYTQAELNFKPVSLEINKTMAYSRPGSSVVPVPAAPATSTAPAANIQIQITDEAGRPLIISIPVQNAPAVPKPTTVLPTTLAPATTSGVVAVPLPVVPPAQPMLPMISTVQGGVRISKTPPPVMTPQQPGPLPVIASVQGMVPLPPLTAIQQPPAPALPQRNDGLPVISCVQSVAQLPPEVPTDKASSHDMYTTTVAEADTQSSSAEQVAAESDGSGSKCSTPVQSQSPAPSSSAAAPVVTTTTAKATTSLAAKKFSSTTQIRIDFLFNGSIDKFDKLEKKVSEMIKHTGFCGQELNACGVEKCNSRYSDPVKLNLHLLKHHTVSSYKCYHCEDRFKTAHELITHIKTHGRHRYLCFMCDQKSHFLKQMIVHVQHDHKSTDVILTYLHPKKRDIHNDLVVICPQNVTQLQLQNYINNILKDDEVPPSVVKAPTQTMTKKKFAPNEIDQLPQQEIFPEDAFCAKCDYATKIKKNFKRHLERHLDQPVPVTVPAIIDVASTAPTTAETSEVAIVPQQIEPEKLYHCGICKFECKPVIADFRSHLYRVHRHEKIYRCIHCNTVVNNGFLCIDKIINHLKLHQEKLFKCSECDYYRDERYLIPPHIKQNHGGAADVVAIREAPAAEEEPEWQCDLCETVLATRAEMIDHMTGDHKLTDKQYKCSYCSYKSSDNDSFKVHFASNHPNCEILIISLFHSLPPKPKATPPPTNDEFAQPGSSGCNEPGNNTKKFSCGGEDCSYSSMNLHIIKKHFKDVHPEEQLVVYDDTGIDPEKRKRFDYFVKYGCGYCTEKFDVMDDVIEHWYNMHMGTGTAEKPLMFKLHKLVRCFYCDTLSTYDDMKEHSATAHPGQLFACVDHQNVFKCGECPHVFNGDSVNLLKHFKIYHSVSKVEDPCDYIEDEFLHRMLEQNNSSYTCNHCKLVYESRFEYESHIAVCEFAGLPSSFKLTTKSIHIRYICSCCNEMFDNEYTIASHVRNHLTQYSCFYCKREFKQLQSLDQHQIEFHNATREASLSRKDLNHHRLFFTKIQMLFPNGLLLSKMDAHRTVCGSVEDIMKYVRTINDEEMFDFRLQKFLQMPLIYEEGEESIQTTCQQFLDSQPTTMALCVENLSELQIAHLCEQVRAIHRMTYRPPEVKRSRGRPPRKKKRMSFIASETEEDDTDDDWRPDNKRIGWTKPSRTSVVKQEPKGDEDNVERRMGGSSSEDELLINLKKEKPETEPEPEQPEEEMIIGMPLGECEDDEHSKGSGGLGQDGSGGFEGFE